MTRRHLRKFRSIGDTITPAVARSNVHSQKSEIPTCLTKRPHTLVINPKLILVVAAAASAAGTPIPSRGADAEINVSVDSFRSATPMVGVRDQVTFLYYTDLEAPRRFYGMLLGLSPYYETPWVTLYRSAPGATIGIVKRADDPISADAKRDAVMVSIVADDVESWYRRLKSSAEIRIEKDIYNHPAVPIRAFVIRDPAGYSVEFFEWRKH